MSTATTPETARDRFTRLAARWKDESRYMSNTAQMALLWSYQSIIGMGREAVPFILDELRREQKQWFWALRAITGDDPVPKEFAGLVRESAQAWIDWGVRNGYTTE